MQLVEDAHKANVQVPVEVSQAAESAKAAWAAVRLVEGLKIDERVTLLKELAQSMALPSVLALSCLPHGCIRASAVLHLPHTAFKAALETVQ